jgi:hypothetical protein
LHEKLQENIDDVKSVILSKTPRISAGQETFDMSDVSAKPQNYRYVRRCIPNSGKNADIVI